ncbi:cation diffusion facilitator family transporter [Pseudomonadota bacterium]
MPEPASPITPAEQKRLLKLATHASVIVAATLVLAKLAAYWYTSSVSVLASLIDSLMDIAASMINLLAVNYALSPPDEEHRFGHGKAESVAGLAQAMFIAGSGMFLILEAISRLLHPKPIEELGIGLSVMIFAVIATLILIAIQQYVIRRTNSAAIRADSLHYKTDVLTNGAIIVALLMSQMGWAGVDPVFAIAIACYILYSAWGIGKEAFHDLLDHELPQEKRELIITIAKEHPKVRGMHDLRTRLSGRTEFIQMHLELDDHLPLVEAHAIADEVELKIKKALPASDVVIHQDPVSSMHPHEQPLFTKE